MHEMQQYYYSGFYSFVQRSGLTVRSPDDRPSWKRKEILAEYSIDYSDFTGITRVKVHNFPYTRLPKNWTV